MHRLMKDRACIRSSCPVGLRTCSRGMLGHQWDYRLLLHLEGNQWQRRVVRRVLRSYLLPEEVVI